MEIYTKDYLREDGIVENVIKIHFIQFLMSGDFSKMVVGIYFHRKD